MAQNVGLDCFFHKNIFCSFNVDFCNDVPSRLDGPFQKCSKCDPHYVSSGVFATLDDIPMALVDARTPKVFCIVDGIKIERRWSIFARSNVLCEKMDVTYWSGVHIQDFDLQLLQSTRKDGVAFYTVITKVFWFHTFHVCL